MCIDIYIYIYVSIFGRVRGLARSANKFNSLTPPSLNHEQLEGFGILGTAYKWTLTLQNGLDLKL